jgi:hypothetical protein
MGCIKTFTEETAGLANLLFRREDEAFIEFGKRKRDAELGKGEGRIRDQDFVSPALADARVDRRADAVLLQHDVALQRRRGWYSRALTIRSTAEVEGLRSSKTTTGSETTVLALSPGVQATNPSG